MKWLYIPLFIFTCLVFAQGEKPSVKKDEAPNYKLKERVASADIIVTGKLLYIGCFDENFVELKPEGPCVEPNKKTQLRFSLRTDDVLKGKNTFLKEHELLQKVFYYIPVSGEMEAEIKNGQQKVFFFKTRDLVPDLIDRINYVPASERAEIEKLIKEN